MRYVLLSNDLMFQSQVRQASHAAGVEMDVCGNADDAIASVGSAEFSSLPRARHDPVIAKGVVDTAPDRFPVFH